MCLLLVGAATSCTDPAESSRSAESTTSPSASRSSSPSTTTDTPSGSDSKRAPSETKRSTKPTADKPDAPSLGGPAAPARTRVTRVAGRWPANRAGPRTSRLERGVGRAVHGWLNRAFVLQQYPTRRFAGSFDTFTPGARKAARDQRGLTTNAMLGPKIVDAVPVRRQLTVSAFAPSGRAIGATASADLQLRTVRMSGRRSQLRVTGELSLTRVGGRWRVFGYDLQRSLRRIGGKSKGDR